MSDNAKGMANLRILKWESEGLRLPDFKVDLEVGTSGAVPRVALIQAPNGTAKTSTLTLLRAALSGEAAGWGHDMVAQFARKDPLTGQLVKPEGHFIVYCLCGIDRYTFTLSFDFENNTCSYVTTTPQGKIKEFKPAPTIRPFLEPNFVKLFVFDGEQAQALSDRSQTKARDAIEVAHRIYLIGRIKQHIQDYYQQTLEKVVIGARGAQARHLRVSQLSKLLRERETELLDFRKSLQDAEAKQETLDKEWADKFASLPEQRDLVEKATSVYAKAESDWENSVRKLGVLARNPAAISRSLSSRLQALQSGLEKAKLPESTAREFFIDLASQDRCVCGRPIGAGEKKYIHDAAGSYLANDAVHVLNRIKSHVRDSLELGEPSHVTLGNSITTCINLSDCKHLAHGALEQAKRKAAQADPLLESTRLNIEKNKARLSDLRRRISDYEDADSSAADSDLLSIPTLKRRLKDAEEAVAATNQARELVDKKNKLMSILDEIIEDARGRVTQETIASTNKLLGHIIPLNNINVESINSQLALRNSAGASMGETLVVAYSFLSSLLTASSGVSMPFVVDSPAGALGGEARNKVAPVLPEMSQQLILFVLDKECSSFLEPLEKSVQVITKTDSAIQYMTLFKRGHVRDADCPGATTQFTKCGRGVLVSGREFFVKFL
jgi:DNA sulfur modification protein DndD